MMYRIVAIQNGEKSVVFDSMSRGEAFACFDVNVAEFGGFSRVEKLLNVQLDPVGGLTWKSIDPEHPVTVRMESYE